MPNRRSQRRRSVLQAAFVAVLVAASATANAQLFIATGRDTLRGLPGLEVVIEPPQPELESSGLGAAAVAADVTAQLTSSAVTVFASQRENTSPAKPYVYVHLNAIGLERGGYAVAIQVQVRQTVSSMTSVSRIVDAVTWDAHTVAAIDAQSLRPDVMREVNRMIGALIVDWKAVH